MAERGRGPGAFTVACGAGRAVVQAWHDEQRVEHDRYAGLLAAGVTDAATLELPAPVPARRVEVARATQVALLVGGARHGGSASGGGVAGATDGYAGGGRAGGGRASARGSGGWFGRPRARGADRGAAGRAVRCGGGGGGSRARALHHYRRETPPCASSWEKGGTRAARWFRKRTGRPETQDTKHKYGTSTSRNVIEHN
eukprot:scaffold41768_cov58-Phaeocystis_antarctica.AAC.1